MTVLWGGYAHAVCLVGAGLIVYSSPSLCGCLSLLCCCKPLGNQHFAAQRAVGAFLVFVMPRCARIDLKRRDTEAIGPSALISTYSHRCTLRLVLAEKSSAKADGARIEPVQRACVVRVRASGDKVTLLIDSLLGNSIGSHLSPDALAIRCFPTQPNVLNLLTAKRFAASPFDVDDLAQRMDDLDQVLLRCDHGRDVLVGRRALIDDRAVLAAFDTRGGRTMILERNLLARLGT